MFFTQRAHDVKMTSYQRRCEVMTSHRCRTDVILTSCACWVQSNSNMWPQGQTSKVKPNQNFEFTDIFLSNVQEMKVHVQLVLICRVTTLQIQEQLSTADKAREAKMKEVKDKQRIREERAKRAREKVHLVYISAYLNIKILDISVQVNLIIMLSLMQN